MILGTVSQVGRVRRVLLRRNPTKDKMSGYAFANQTYLATWLGLYHQGDSLGSHSSVFSRYQALLFSLPSSAW